jgi:hypothetical protein
MAIRIEGRWVSMGGKPEEPEGVILGDTNLKAAAKSSVEYGIHPNDSVVAIWDGTTKDAKTFFGFPRNHTLSHVSNIVLLGYGTNNLWKKDQGGIKVPACTPNKFLEEYGELLDQLHASFREALILSSDPMPCHTTGFANAAIDCFWRRTHQHFPKHHHLHFANHYWKQKGKTIFGDLFDAAGENLKAEEIKILIEAAYESLALLKIEPDPPKNTYLSKKGYILKF